jgi:DNA-binding transcriptional ArsR family regulator
MDVSEIVPVFRALADPVRLQLVGLIAGGERCNAELAAELGVSPATVSHHLKVLRRAGLLRERRESPYVFIELDDKALRRAVKAVADKKTTSKLTAKDQRSKVISTFFEGDTLRAIPAKRSKKEIVFEEILRRLPPAESYTERQLSKLIERHHSDFCTIRRELIMGRYMTRERGRYRLAPRGMAVVNGAS